MARINGATLSAYDYIIAVILICGSLTRFWNVKVTIEQSYEYLLDTNRCSHLLRHSVFVLLYT